MSEPTMRYRPDAVDGARKSESKVEYYYRVFEGDEVASSLKDGWYEHFDNFSKNKAPKKKAPKKKANVNGN